MEEEEEGGGGESGLHVCTLGMEPYNINIFVLSPGGFIRIRKYRQLQYSQWMMISAC